MLFNGIELPDDASWLLITFYTGHRAGELHALRASDLDNTTLDGQNPDCLEGI